MKLSEILYNPIILLLISVGLSIYTTRYYQFVFNFYGQIVALTFIFYLLICYVNDVQLVLRRMLPWYVLFVIPLFGLFMSISTSDDDIVSSTVLSLTIFGTFYLIIGLMIYVQHRKTSKFIRKNLSEYLILEKLAIPHVLATHKYYFKDFTTMIHKMFTADSSTFIRSTKEEVAAGAIIQAGARAVEKQLGNPEGYVFDVYLEKDPGNEYTIYELGNLLNNFKKAFRNEEYDNQKLRALAREIDPQVEENLAMIYFTKLSFNNSRNIKLKLVFDPDYFEAEPKRIYQFISDLQKHI